MFKVLQWNDKGNRRRVFAGYGTNRLRVVVLIQFWTFWRHEGHVDLVNLPVVTWYGDDLGPAPKRVNPSTHTL